jgi:hypothetical protein
MSRHCPPSEASKARPERIDAVRQGEFGDSPRRGPDDPTLCATADGGARLGLRMKTVHFILYLLMACGGTQAADDVPSDEDSTDECPEYPIDGGTITLHRGCPLTIEYQIK